MVGRTDSGRPAPHIFESAVPVWESGRSEMENGGAAKDFKSDFDAKDMSESRDSLLHVMPCLAKCVILLILQFMLVFELPQIDTNQQDRLSFGRNINYFNIIE